MFVRQLLSVGLLAIGLAFVTARPALGQDASSGLTPVPDVAPVVVAVPLAVAAVPSETVTQAERPTVEASPGKRPAWFLPIHLLSVAVQGLEADSTFEALKNRSIETNSSSMHLSGNKVAFLAVKAGMAAAVVYATDKLSKRHRVGAVVAAAAVNSIYLAIAANNYRSARAMEARFGR